MNHLIISLSWQGDYWQKRPTDAEMQNSGHGYAKEGNLPWERKNFNFIENVDAGFKYGYIQTRGESRVYKNGSGIVFFYSNNYIVGLYAEAEINKAGYTKQNSLDSEELNIRAPIGLCVRWKELTRLPVNKERYYLGQTRMSQAGALNIEDDQAWNIIEDAISAHSDAPEIQENLLQVRDAIWGDKTAKDQEWLVKLRQWLADGNSKRMSSEKYQLQADFVSQFPMSQLSTLALRQYAIGYPNSLAYWIGVRTKPLGGIGGATVGKFGVLLKKNGQWLIDGKEGDEQQANVFFDNLKAGMVKIIEAAQATDFEALDTSDNALFTKRTLRSKLIYLYFPDEFLPIFSQEHLTHFLAIFDQVAMEGKLLGSNKRLWYIQQAIPELAELDTQQFKEFLYHCFPVAKVTEEIEEEEIEEIFPELTPEAVKPLLAMAERTRNILLYGPPGTGKTWLVTQFAKAFTDANKTEMVTFHQSFAYEEFVEGIKPVIAEHGQVAYTVQDGVFKRICQAAAANPSENYLLVIDEINRANIAKVLGELITLIEDDKRLGEANEVLTTLPYSGEKFGVPPNLTILGTMNTADRSIALLDLALRRRFTFVEMPPDPALLSLDVAGVNLQALLTRLNRRVAALLDPDHRIGHSYLMSVETENDLHFAWYHRVLPLLQEYFYHDGERMQAVIGKAFVQEVTLDAETKAALGGAYDETAQYDTVLLTGEAFREALQEIAGQ